MSAPLRIAILPGSSRANANHGGFCKWVHSRLSLLLPSASLPILSLASPPLPLGPVTTEIIPAALAATASPNPSTPGLIDYAYDSPATVAWSHLVQSFDAVVIVTPQYNWGYPGELKNAIDHLYPEWHGLPVAVMTYGGHGGTKCAEAMQLVLAGIKCENVSCGEVMIAFPGKQYVTGPERVTGNEEWVKAWEGKVDEVLGRVVDAATRRKAAKEALASGARVAA